MIVNDFLSHLIQRDVYLSVSGDNLIVDAPEGVLTNYERTQLRVHKTELIALLSEVKVSFTNLYAKTYQDVRQWLDERAAIGEFEGGLPRPQAEFQALHEYQTYHHQR